MKHPMRRKVMITGAGVTIAALLSGAALSCAASRNLHREPLLRDTLPQRRDAETMGALARRNPIEEELAVPPAPDAAKEETAISDVGGRPRIGDDVARQLDLRGTPLSEAVHLIAAMAGVNVYLDAGLTAQVDASFPSVTLDDALGVLLERNGLTLVEEPAGIYWVLKNDGSQEASATFRLQSVNAADVADNLTALITGESLLVVDAAQNLVVVRGPQRDVDSIRDYLEVADHLKKQVLIEVEILEINLSDEYEFGIGHIFSEPNFLGEASLGTVSDLATAADSFTATLDFNDFSLATTVNALSTYGVVQVLSSPRVMAITNTVANIEVITEIPYIEVSTAIESGGGSIGDHLLAGIGRLQGGGDQAGGDADRAGGGGHSAFDLPGILRGGGLLPRHPRPRQPEGDQPVPGQRPGDGGDRGPDAGPRLRDRSGGSGADAHPVARPPLPQRRGSDREARAVGDDHAAGAGSRGSRRPRGTLRATLRGALPRDRARSRPLSTA